MPICPECHSRDIVKFGNYDGNQKYHCKQCGLTTIYPRNRMLKANCNIRKFIARSKMQNNIMEDYII